MFMIQQLTSEYIPKRTKSRMSQYPRQLGGSLQTPAVHLLANVHTW